MAVKITEPNLDPVNSNDWFNFITRTTKQGGGFICLELTYIDSTERPDIVAGSRLEVNGAFYEVGPNNETISGTPTTPGVSENNYIYAKPGTNGSLSFSFSNTVPTWSAKKGGWYSGNDRAIAKFFFTNSSYNNKVILDSYNAMQNVNTKQTVPSSGGVSVFSQEPGGTPSFAIVNAVPGMYRFQVRGGSAGNGGAAGAGGGSYGNSAAGSNGNPGAGNNTGESRSGTFIHPGGDIHIKVGADGGNGGNGGNGANASSTGPNSNSIAGDGGAGGGGGSGIESVLNGIVVHGGLPGRGGLNNKTGLHGQNGSYGIGGDGLKGDDNSTGSGTAGTRGGGIKTTSNGYARIWRVG